MDFNIFPYLSLYDTKTIFINPINLVLKILIRGFFVFNTKIFDYLKNDKTILEKSPLENLAISGNLSAFKHDGFWFAMDSLRDKKYLEERWYKNQAPWKIW